ncbi:hypothetical protein EVJ58_g2209 [Rhodofomes roseus]|uniref:DUF676 domain-containing protein n=1 Tax=Rhodofomes roseus TaxID=34475 RepID=A0A4Y9YU39_9APHY|nr:hypothetical protein EVJ58_g2209 [Rhodofomes roseus]
MSSAPYPQNWGIGENHWAAAHARVDHYDSDGLLVESLDFGRALFVPLDMHPLWLPANVALLFRRVVNVVSSLSISQHYLLPRLQPGVDGTNSAEDRLRLWEGFNAIRWPSWATADQGFPSTARLQLDVGVERMSGHSDAADVDRETPDHSPQRNAPPKDTIHQLIHSPVLYDPVRKPRNPIALCHGLYGFDVRGPSTFPILQMHYWSNVLSIIRDKLGAEVIVTSVPSTGSVASRAQSLDRFLREKAPGRGINFMAHSMGGLDCRHLISNIRPTEYTPLSLTTIATPHCGSPFMDWCRENIGIGRLRQKEQAEEAGRRLAEDDAGSPSSPTSHDVRASSNPRSPKSALSLASLPSSFTTLLLSVLDSPAYANLTSTYLNTIFNPATPDHPSVKYFSVAGRMASTNVWHPLWLPKMVLEGFEEREREGEEESTSVMERTRGRRETLNYDRVNTTARSAHGTA